MINSNSVTWYFDLLFSCSLSSSKGAEIQLDPELFFDYCEVCNVKCDSEILHQCIYKLQIEDEQQQFQFPYLLVED